MRDGFVAHNRSPMSGDVLEFHQIDGDRAAECGGKGANLGALSRIEGVSVPPGFCVTTSAFRRVVLPALSRFRA